MGNSTEPKRQLAWVFDLNKCIGCQTCSVACKTLWPGDDPGTESMWWLKVNTLPGRGAPRDWETMGGGYVDGRLQLGRIPTAEEIGGGWDFNYEEVLAGGVGQDAHLRKIRGKPGWSMNWEEDEGAGDYPNSYYYYLPRLCMHCTDAPCLEACPNDAIFKRTEDGLVLVNEDRCDGTQSCRAACPYKVIDFNPVRRVAQKCIGCFPRAEKGVAPACVRQCPGRAAFIGYVDDEESAVSKLVNKWGVALPLHPEFETKPNVYYVPPLAPMAFDQEGRLNEQGSRIPPEYVESQFGPRVHGVLDRLREEIARKGRGESSELMDTLIVFEWKDALGHLDGDPAKIIWMKPSPSKGDGK